MWANFGKRIMNGIGRAVIITIAEIVGGNGMAKPQVIHLVMDVALSIAKGMCGLAMRMKIPACTGIVRYATISGMSLASQLPIPQ
jgi:hypothetical protein